METILRQFDIHFVGLKEGVTEFTYTINDSFFEHFECSLIEHGNIEVKLNFDKQHSLFQLDFQITGTVHLPCNRCNDMLDFPVDADCPMIVKMDDRMEGDEEGEDADVMFISRSENTLNVAQLIYEFINLNVPPYKAVCERMNKTCNPEMIKELEKYKNENEHTPAADPRWDSLKKIKLKK